jgi:O-antigen/teichoic acid export membrane protein
MEIDNIAEQKYLQELSLKEKTAKGILWGGVSNFLQQFLYLVFGIVLSRILNADDYGLVGMLAIFTAIATLLQEGGFTAALTNKKEVTHEDYNAVFWFSLLSSLLIYGLLFLLAPVISDFFGEPKLLLLSRVVFLSFVISGIGVVPSTFLFKNLKVKENVISNIVALLFSGIIGIILALNGYSYWGLAIQTVIYVFIGTVLRWFYAKWVPAFHIDMTPLKSMFGFSIKLIFTNIFFQITNHIYSVILGKYYNPTQVGYYTQGNKWQTMGSSVVTSIFSHITQPLFIQAEINNSDPVKVFRKLLRFAAFLSFPLMLGLSFVSKEFIIIAIGEKWLLSVPILQILCVWGAFSPIWRLYNELLISKGKSDYYLNVNIVVGSIQILLAFLMYPYGIHKMLMVYLAVNFFGLFICHYYANKVIGLRFFNVLKDILPYLLITLGVYGIAYFFTAYIDNLYLRFALKLIIPIFLYTGIMILTKSVMFKESAEFLKQQVKKLKT